MQKDYFDELIRRYKEDKLSPVEQEILEEWLENIHYPSQGPIWSVKEKLDLQGRILSKAKIKSVTPLWKKLAVAATLLTVLALGYEFFKYNSSSLELPEDNMLLKHDTIKPGGDKGILYTQGEAAVSLTTLRKDSVYQFNNLLVERISSSKIKVKAIDGAEEHIHRLHAPKGGNFTVLLEDGSALTLNANSSISFPSRFNDSQRNVSADGEVFFDINKDQRKRPFIVSVGNSTSIKVLGTKFNVNYKKGESLRTALFEGAVLVSNPKFEVYLKPGKELIADQSGNYSVKNFINEQVGAWKEGYFSLDNKNIAEIMDELADWYDVEIDYNNANLQVRYQGSISRFSDIQTVLDILSLAKGNSFEIKGRRVMVK